MIGISIYADSIRAIKGNIKSQELKIAKSSFYALKKGDIVQGKIKNSENIKNVILAIKEDLKIEKNDEVYLTLPDGISVLCSYPTKEAVYEKSDFLDKYPQMKKNNRLDVLTVENDYFENKLNERLKPIPCVYVSNLDIEKYIEIFNDCEITLANIETNAVTSMRRIEKETTDNFLFVDIEYDYSTIVLKTKKYGSFMYVVSDIGNRELIKEEYDQQGVLVNYTPSKNHINNLIKKIGLVIEYLKNQVNVDFDINSFDKIIFPNKDYNCVIEEFVEYFSGKQIITIEKLTPIGVNEKTLNKVDLINFGLLENEINLFYNPMEALLGTQISKMGKTNLSSINLLSEEEKNIFNIEKTKKKISNILLGVCAIVGVYGFITITYNGLHLYLTSPDASKVDDNLKQEYEKAKKDKKEIESNIIKYNTVAELKKESSPLLDHIVAVKPIDTKISVLEINQGAKKITIEGFTTNPNDMNNFLAKVKEHYLLDKAQITTSESKNSVMAFQIVAPINM